MVFDQWGAESHRGVMEREVALRQRRKRLNVSLEKPQWSSFLRQGVFHRTNTREDTYAQSQVFDSLSFLSLSLCGGLSLSRSEICEVDEAKNPVLSEVWYSVSESFCCQRRSLCRADKCGAPKSSTFTPPTMLSDDVVKWDLLLSHVVTVLHVTGNTCDKQFYIYLTAYASSQPHATLSLGYTNFI